MSTKETFMNRAFDLAQLGAGNVSPNPLVGCVIVHDEKIIGEGYHMKYGQAHAEVNAVNSVEDKSLLKDSEVYVTLEPCSHFGKTPPCSDLLISHRVKRVMVSNLDPNPLVAGRGIEKLNAAGIEVETGLMESKGELINRRFFTVMRKKRPYVILKWAETADGFIARENFDSKWISDKYSRKLVHKWRAEEDAILVGTNTAQYDNPTLNVRDWDGRDPLRVVIDRSLRLSSDLNLFRGGQATVCYNEQKDDIKDNTTYRKINFDALEDEMLTDLLKRNISSIIIEGGSKVLHSFIEKDLWDEMRVFKSPTNFESGISAPEVKGTLKESEKLVNDQLEIYLNHG
ncbi:MAG: bifunctional diaminohydroxyphosphoribosylaminopyrimidine deaminase/5-amino-6-(5-phosphoribosylamino)uracil reductase RibD [bacterium]|nr:bifunctional diaminohydroxyphosphoribosylaminopyrimidine deaminase/5-amino-6-(5-phosphoribosylamino)uracil reductase RibD [bacterium]